MKYILLYRGPLTPPDAFHSGWREWFTQVGDGVVDIGSPMRNGHSVSSDGTLADSAPTLNGYSVIETDDFEAAWTSVADHPYLSLGAEYSIDIYEVPKK
jgi:hypothetical protein